MPTNNNPDEKQSARSTSTTGGSRSPSARAAPTRRVRPARASSGPRIHRSNTSEGSRSAGRGAPTRRVRPARASSGPKISRPNTSESTSRSDVSSSMQHYGGPNETPTSRSPRRKMNRSRSANVQGWSAVKEGLPHSTRTPSGTRLSGEDEEDFDMTDFGMTMSGRRTSSSRYVRSAGASKANTDANMEASLHVDAIPSSTTTKTTERQSKHSSNVARRFLNDDDDDDDDEFDLGRPKPTTTTSGGAAGTAADFQMSQLKFPNISGGMFDDSSGNDRQRFQKKTLSEENVFVSRQDLREVDQSVNLMDAETAKYETRGNKRTSGGGRGSHRAKHRQSMVDIFLGESAAADSPFNPKSKRFSGFYHKGDGHLDGEETWWDRFTNCLGTSCKIVCSLPVLILALILGSGLALIPLILDKVEESATAVKATPAPTIAATTLAPAIETAANGEAPPLFTTEQVEARMQDLQDILLQEEFEDYTDAGLAAIQWMAAYDPAMMVLVHSAPVIARFATAAVYFAMHPDVTADSATLGIMAAAQEERTAGRQLSSNHWMSQASICDWHGIDCEDEHVVHLNMSHTNLQGSLPEELTLMTELIELDLSHNQIHGSLPASYPTKLSKLEYVWLHVNQIEGSLPASIGDWTTLYHLDVSENQLTGSLPTSLAKLTQTRLLYLDHNQFQGSIPLQLGHLPKIEYLYLSHNELTGELPMDLLSKLSTIVDLRLNKNALTGTVPPEIESLHRLEFLHLANNQLRGELPDVFDRLHYLVELDLHTNSFTGPLPESLGKATSLERLLLQHNDFSGPVPDALCALTEPPFIAADCESKIQCDSSCCEKCY